MRADMAKVLVERPRLGSRMRSRPGKGYWKSYHRAIEAGDSPPTRKELLRYPIPDALLGGIRVPEVVK